MFSAREQSYHDKVTGAGAFLFTSNWLELCIGVCFVCLAHPVVGQLEAAEERHRLNSGATSSRRRRLLLFPFPRCVPADVGRRLVGDTDVFKHGGLHCREIQSPIFAACVCVCVSELTLYICMKQFNKSLNAHSSAWEIQSIPVSCGYALSFHPCPSRLPILVFKANVNCWTCQGPW